MSQDNLQRCGNCGWWGMNGTVAYCRFPLPFWVGRELHDPLAGHSASASMITPASGEGCTAWRHP